MNKSSGVTSSTATDLAISPITSTELQSQIQEQQKDKELQQEKANLPDESITQILTRDVCSSSSMLFSAAAADDSEFLSATKYLDDVNNLDLKYCHIRLLNNSIFVVGCVLYVWMDAIPYSGLNGPTVDDDDTLETVTDLWMNKYSILYFLAATMFVITAVLDFYFVTSALSNEEIEEQIINRQQARVRAQKRNPRSNRGTFMGFSPSVMPTAGNSALDNNNNNDDDDDNNHNNDGNKNLHNCCYNNNIKIIEFFCSIRRLVSISASTMVLVICWALLLGGAFGIASSVFVVKRLLLSDIFNAVSVHLFFIQACAMIHARLCSVMSKEDDCSNENDNIYNHENDGDNDDNHDTIKNDKNDNERMICVTKCFLIIGDIAFFFGALIDVIYCYIYIFMNVDAEYFEQAVATLISGILWLICSLLYQTVTVYDYHNLNKDIKKGQESFLQEEERTRLQQYHNQK